jgi:hypothetical protein
MDVVPKSAFRVVLFEAFSYKLGGDRRQADIVQHAEGEHRQVDIVQHAEGEVKTLSDGTKYKTTHRGWVKMKGRS